MVSHPAAQPPQDNAAAMQPNGPTAPTATAARPQTGDDNESRLPQRQLPKAATIEAATNTTAMFAQQAAQARQKEARDRLIAASREGGGQGDLSDA